jgi:hypothetical protein
MAERTTPAVRIKRPVGPREQPSLFGPRPLIAGEDVAAYDELLARFSAVIKPKDVLEEMWVRDIVDLTWDTLRMRRLKAGLLTSVTWEGLKEVLKALVDPFEADILSKDWAARNRQAVKKVDKLLTSKRLTMDLAIARALSANVDSFERIDRMAMNAEARRNAALRELERHRASLALALRQASDDVVEAQFVDVRRGSGMQKGVHDQPS